MAITEVVIGSTRKKLRVQILDDDAAPVNIAGGSARLQGVAATPAESEKTFDVAGSIYDAANGVFEWAGLGDPDDYVAESDLGDLASVSFALRVRFEDAAGKVDFGPLFQIPWSKAPAIS